MEVPCQCLSSLPTKHPTIVLSILSSAPTAFTEQRMEVEKDDEGLRERKRKSREEKQVNGDEEQRCCRSNKEKEEEEEGNWSCLCQRTPCFTA